MNSGHECEIGEFSLELLMPVKLVKCPTELRQATQAQPTASQWSRQHRAPFQLPSIIQIRKCCNEKHSGSDNSVVSVTVSPVDFDLGTFISMSSIKYRILNRKLPCSSRSIYWLFHTCCSGLRLITFLRSSLSLPPSLEKHCHRVIMLHQRWLLEGILCTKWFKEDCGNERTNELLIHLAHGKLSPFCLFSPPLLSANDSSSAPFISLTSLQSTRFSIGS